MRMGTMIKDNRPRSSSNITNVISIAALLLAFLALIVMEFNSNRHNSTLRGVGSVFVNILNSEEPKEYHDSHLHLSYLQRIISLEKKLIRKAESIMQVGDNKVSITIWRGPFCSHGGYAVEAQSSSIALLLAMIASESPETSISQSANLFFASHFGDTVFHQTSNAGQLCQKEDERREPFSLVDSQLIRTTIEALESRIEKVVVVCHSTADRWEGNQCVAPFTSTLQKSKIPVILIGRTMFETDSVPWSWTPGILEMDQIWVPSLFNKKIFDSHLSHFSSLSKVPTVKIVAEGIASPHLAAYRLSHHHLKLPLIHTQRLMKIFLIR